MLIQNFAIAEMQVLALQPNSAPHTNHPPTLWVHPGQHLQTMACSRQAHHPPSSGNHRGRRGVRGRHPRHRQGVQLLGVVGEQRVCESKGRSRWGGAAY